MCSWSMVAMDSIPGDRVEGGWLHQGRSGSGWSGTGGLGGTKRSDQVGWYVVGMAIM